MSLTSNDINYIIRYLELAKANADNIRSMSTDDKYKFMKLNVEIGGIDSVKVDEMLESEIDNSFNNIYNRCEEIIQKLNKMLND